jgi:hypothetical protein
VRLALSLIGRSQQKQYIMFYNTVVLGLDKPLAFAPPVVYRVPADKRAQTVYFRAGDPSTEMIYLVLTAAGKAMRYFPVGAKGAIHVPLALLEDISPGTEVEILIAGPAGLTSSVMIDVGFVEID